jgi:L,D-peptidoglycan transpeptidase YkuD (ErfK/YbiS/YcfS/YnhG family)
MRSTHRAAAMLAAVAVPVLSSVAGAQPQSRSQSCPAPLADARRLVLVTAKTMNEPAAEMQLYERASPAERWRAIEPSESVVVGRGGIGWSHFFRRYARVGEPIKVEGDKRAPAGFYRIGRSFGTVPSSRPGHIGVTDDTVCVYEPSSPHYNRILSRKLAGPDVAVENMSRMLPMYRRGLVVDYPTDGRARAGSCIFIHVWKTPTTGTAGCVAMPEARVEALQDFAAGGAVIAILPQQALSRFAACLPKPGDKPGDKPGERTSAR